jgi:CHAT domain-containing protein
MRLWNLLKLLEAAAVVLVLQHLVAVAAAGQADEAAQDLRPGAPIERELAKDQVHRYRVALAAGEYVRILVHHKGVHLRASLADPAGRPIMSSRYNHALRPESVSTVADAPGEHELAVAAMAGGDERGTYRVSIDVHRPADSSDRARALAERMFTAALELRHRDNAESLKAALSGLQEALRHWQAAGDRIGEALTLGFLASVHGALGEPKPGLRLQEQALAIFRDEGDRVGEAETLNNIGVQLYRLSDYQAAARHFEAALPIQRSLEDLRGLASSLSNLGSIYWVLSDPAKALDYNHQVIPLRRTLRDRSGEARTLNNLGTVYQDLGEYQKALESYLAALTVRRDLKDQRGEAHSLGNLAALQESLGRFPDALEAANEALRLHRLVGDRQGETGALQVIARVRRALSDPKEAIARAREALSIARAIGYRAGEGLALTILAQILNDSGDCEAALAAGAEAAAVCKSVGTPRCQAIAATEIGIAATALGLWDRAADELASALAVHQAIRSSAGEAGTRLALARLERARGRLDEARAQAEKALSVIESERARVASDALRASYLAARQDAYVFAIDLLMQMHAREPTRGHDVAALETSERARARRLLDVLVEAGADIREGVDPALLAEERALRQRLNALEANRLRLLDQKNAQAQVADLDREIGHTLVKVDALRARIRTQSPRYAALTEPRPLTASDIQQQVLDEDSTLLHYALANERSVLWVVTRSSIASHELPGKADIESAARRFHELLTVSHARQRAFAAQRAADELGNMLLGPVSDRLRTKRLVIVADGALQFIPFGALRLGAMPLVRRYEIVNLPSASTLAVLRRELSGRPAAPRLAAVLADPVLESADPRVTGRVSSARSGSPAVPTTSGGPGTSAPGPFGSVAHPISDLVRSGSESGLNRFQRLVFTRREAEAIRRLAGSAAILIALDFDASLQTVVSADLAQYRLVHLATHGLLNSRHPELSGLVLSLVDEQGRGRDGFLRSYDVYNLRLGADLVVLSACRTALGQEIRGEGLVGLVRGFMYAGAPRVVASLWDVKDDATAAFMDRFYAGMIRGRLSPASALRDAQIWMSTETRWRAPYYWAGFVLQGDWR